MNTKENVTVYKCDFCSKKLFVKKAMENHEKGCSKNPINQKPCHFCEHLSTIEKEVWFENVHYHPDHGNSEGDRKKVKVFKCDKLDKLMFPYSIEKNKRHIVFPSTYEEQEPMPNRCSYFSDNFMF